MSINATLIFQIIAFALLIWFVNKVLWGPLSQMMGERQKRIADGLAAGEKGKHELELAEKRAAEILREAKTQAAEVKAAAEKQVAQMLEEARTNAKTEGERQLAAAQAEIAREVNAAKEQLRTQVAGLAATGASRILKREIDAQAHADLLRDVVGQI